MKTWIVLGLCYMGLACFVSYEAGKYSELIGQWVKVNEGLGR